MEEYWARVTFEADRALGFPGGVGLFLSWTDDQHRSVVLAELLPEVLREIDRRKEVVPDLTVTP